MKELFDRTGVMAIGTRLRILSETVIKKSEDIYSLYDVQIKPKWYPVIYSLLEDKQPKTVTQIANEIGHSHVSVVKIVKELSKADMLIEIKDINDGRKTNINLSKKGKELTAGLEFLHKDTTLAMEKMLSDTRHNLWLALEEFEELYEQRSTYLRVLDEKRIREAKKTQIVEFEEKYAKEFEDLNLQWLTKYFEPEEKDFLVLSNPKKYILDEGGHILVGLYENKVAAVCALIKSENENYDYEMVKMVVRPELQGKGIGLIIAKAIINKAKSLNAKSIFLESHTMLTPAITLYKKLGFKKVVQFSKLYKRSNIRMELFLD